MEESKHSDSVFLQWDCAENAKKTQKLEKLKRKLLKILNMYDLYRGVPCERERPEGSENVVVFVIWRFKAIVIGCQSRVKFQEKISVKTGVAKKQHSVNTAFCEPKRRSGLPNMVGTT